MKNTMPDGASIRNFEQMTIIRICIIAFDAIDVEKSLNFVVKRALDSPNRINSNEKKKKEKKKKADRGFIGMVSIEESIHRLRSGKTSGKNMGRGAKIIKEQERGGGVWTRESGKSETIVARVCSRRGLVRAQFARQENACFDGSSCGTLLILHFSRFDELPYWTNGPNTEGPRRPIQPASDSWLPSKIVDPPRKTITRS